ncbi:hypothetical protein [Bacillus sp. OK048]|uniref:hypothetical protein n=1 Tax=Bacillus sp. OK048 TaxID=1882761 RepID=UPI000891842C|nr:hypothetical protein [Bacillus sp. OK048]SDM85511.1 hypothetical protein SAMN05443253_10661 [Bacillus sp. OK048]
MTTSNTTIDEKYNKAIQSLKKINNDLFYDDLKKMIKEREETLAELNEEVYESIDKMKESLKHFPVQVSEQLKEEVIDPQSQVFDRGMERFDETIACLEKKISFWHQEYQDYLLKTEKLLAEVKGLELDDQEFIVGEAERVLTAIRLLQEQLTEALSEQAATLNVKYEAVSDRLGVLLQEVSVVEESHKAEFAQFNQQIVHDQKELQAKWEEKWKLSIESGAKREELFKKWLIGLAVGQGVSIGLMVLFLVMK